MPMYKVRLLLRIAAVAGAALVLAGCADGQFDPTTLLDNDMFNTKKKVVGQREPVFPNGVPGASTGIPPDLVKGYQPPPEQAADNADPAAAQAKTAAAAPEPAPKPKPKPKAKPKVAAVRPPKPKTTISVGLRPQQDGASQQTRPADNAWPAPPNANTQVQTNWPAPPQPGQQAGQTANSIWPDPPAPGRTTQ